MKLILSIAALAATPPLQPARAQDDGLVTVMEAVDHADLDLRTARGASVLAARMRSAARRACGPTSDVDLEGQTEARRCMAKTTEQARAVSNRLVASAGQALQANATAQGAATSRAAPVALHLSEQ